MRIKYKMRYYFGKILAFFGICRYCYNPTMRLPSGGPDSTPSTDGGSNFPVCGRGAVRRDHCASHMKQLPKA